MRVSFLMPWMAWVGIIIGVVYPEAKNLFYGIPYVAIFLSTLFLIYALTNLRKADLFYVTKYNFLLLLYGLANYFLFHGSAPEIVRQLSSLIAAPTIAYLIFKRYEVDNILDVIWKFAFVISVIFIFIRIFLFDFSRNSFFLGFGPITFSYFICVGMLACVIQNKKRNPLIYFLMMIPLYIAESKGPFIAFCITFLIFIVSNFSHKKTMGKTWILLVLMSAMFFIQSARVEVSLSELRASNSSLSIQDKAIQMNIQENEAQGDTSIRLIAWQRSLKIILNNFPAGIGIGKWGQSSNLDYLEYPHNFILQLLSDSGLIGLLVLLIVFYRFAIKLTEKSPWAYLGVFFLIAAFFSGTTKDYRFIYLFYLIMNNFYAKKRI